MVDLTLDDDSMNILKSMVGKYFDHYSHDPFYFSPVVFDVVGFYIGEESFKLDVKRKVVEYFFDVDDVSFMTFVKTEPEKIVSYMENGKLIDSPAHDEIVGIDVVNDREIVTCGADRREVFSTKGVIFRLASGNEISFEIQPWFSEMITIQRGYDLIKKFVPLEDFLEDWEPEEGEEVSEEERCVPQCSREIVELRRETTSKRTIRRAGL